MCACVHVYHSFNGHVVNLVNVLMCEVGRECMCVCVCLPLLCMGAWVFSAHSVCECQVLRELVLFRNSVVLFVLSD
jgi:hypothetical protein